MVLYSKKAIHTYMHVNIYIYIHEVITYIVQLIYVYLYISITY